MKWNNFYLKSSTANVSEHYYSKFESIEKVKYKKIF